MSNDIADRRVIHKQDVECDICKQELWVSLDHSDATICESCIRKEYEKKKSLIIKLRPFLDDLSSDIVYIDSRLCDRIEDMLKETKDE